MNQSSLNLDDEKAEKVEIQIQELQKITDYEIREWPISVLVGKFTDGRETDEAELFIPDYQREMIWSAKQQSRFIESILIRLPVPFLFVADVPDGKDRAGNLEIIDGSQRIRTLDNFLSDRLTLEGLERLTEANGMKFSQFSRSRKLRFQRQTIRVIEITEKADEAARREMFDRLNSGGTNLKDMEIRRGVDDGPYMSFIISCAEHPLFQELVVPDDAKILRKEREEMVLRYFAYCDNYQNFKSSVRDFLTNYLRKNNTDYSEEKSLKQRQDFEKMLSFVKAYFPNGFKRKNYKSVPRIRFEAISVGITLALKECPELVPNDVTKWLDTPDFFKLTRSDASNSRPKVINRIHFVRDNLLGRPVQYDPKTSLVENNANADASPDESENNQETLN